MTGTTGQSVDGNSDADAGGGLSAGPDGDRKFEDLMAELEQVTETLAGGDLGIEAAADLYERAQYLHALATERLAQVQQRIERLSKSEG